MKENDVIILDNDEKYTILSEVTYENNRYLLTAGFDEKDHIDRNKIVILKVVTLDDGEYVELISDESLTTKLMEKFSDVL